MEINRIKKLRIARGLTQAQLAKKAGVSERSIWNAENNKISPLIMNKIVKGFTKTTEIVEVLETLSKVVKKEKIMNGEIMDEVTYSITITWGTEGEETKTYTFKTLEELEAFRNGVHESNGWWEYEIKGENNG